MSSKAFYLIIAVIIQSRSKSRFPLDVNVVLLNLGNPCYINMKIFYLVNIDVTWQPFKVYTIC